jgi:hypothetical protein
MHILIFLLLLLCYLLTGYGILQLFNLRLKPAYTLSLSLLLGIAMASFLPFLLQLFYIEITPTAVFGFLLLTCLLLNLPLFDRIRKEGFAAFRRSLPRPSFQVRPYEIPYWVIIGFLIFVSVWRCYYLPPTSRDALSGPEAIAEAAVREHTLINSFFSVDLWSTNNQFKSPFLISLQVIYKMAGFPFGQIWLSVIFISFTIFLYHALKERLHPLLAGLLLLLFIMTPEMYAYTFMILYDYSNMVFFFLSLYFLFESISAKGRMAEGPSLDAGARGLSFAEGRKGTGTKNKTAAHFQFAGLMMGIATYIRSETLAIALLFLPLILLVQWRDKLPVKKMAVADGLFLLPSFLGYYLPSQLYIKHYLPVHYDIGGLVNNHLSTLGPLFQRYSDIVTRLFSGEFSIHLWGYFFYLTAILFLAELIFLRRFNKEARNWLYAIVVLYLGLGALGWLLPMMNLNETTKRAMFKMLPLALFYLANNELLLRLSQSISRWEATPSKWSLFGPSAGKPAPAAAKAALTRSGKTIVTTSATPASAKPRNTPPAVSSKKKRKT